LAARNVSEQIEGGQGKPLRELQIVRARDPEQQLSYLFQGRHVMLSDDRQRFIEYAHGVSLALFSDVRPKVVASRK
jgi:hypothetical protein